MTIRMSLWIAVCLLQTVSSLSHAQDSAAVAAPEVAAPEVSNTASLPGDTAATPAVAATPAGTSACVPDCREGYICHQGACIYACNPICAPGYGCLSNGSCVPMPPSAAPAQIVYVDPAAQQRQQQHAQKAADRAAAAAARKEYRLSPRFTLHMGTAVLGSYNTDAFGWGGSLGLGFRKNFVDFFGLQIRFNTTLGTLQQSYYNDYYYGDYYYGDYYDSENVFFTAIDGEVIPFFGPFSRFYFGPIIFVGGFWYDETSLPLGGSVSDGRVPEGLTAGAGFDMGVLVGPRDMIDINWRFKSAFFTEDMPFFLQVGVAIHFMKMKN